MVDHFSVQFNRYFQGAARVRANMSVSSDEVTSGADATVSPAQVMVDNNAEIKNDSVNRMVLVFMVFTSNGLI